MINLQPQKYMQSQKSHFNNKTMRLLVLTAFALFALTEPAYAQAWAQKAVSVGEQFVNGLKILGRVIATIVGIWGAYEIMSGRKRFADMMNWFVGAVVFVSITEVVNLMFGA